MIYLEAEAPAAPGLSDADIGKFVVRDPTTGLLAVENVLGHVPDGILQRLVKLGGTLYGIYCYEGAVKILSSLPIGVFDQVQSDGAGMAVPWTPGVPSLGFARTTMSGGFLILELFNASASKVGSGALSAIQQPIFIDTAGNDANPGTAALPKLTLENALKTAGVPRGSLLIFANPGSYDPVDVVFQSSNAILSDAGDPLAGTYVIGSFEVALGPFATPVDSGFTPEGVVVMPQAAPPAPKDFYFGKFILLTSGPDAGAGFVPVTGSLADGTLLVRQQFANDPIVAGTEFVLQECAVTMTFNGGTGFKCPGGFEFDLIHFIGTDFVESVLGRFGFFLAEVEGSGPGGPFFNSGLGCFDQQFACGLTYIHDVGFLGVGNPFAWHADQVFSGCAIRDCFVVFHSSRWATEATEFLNSLVAGDVGNDTIAAVFSGFRGVAYYGLDQIEARTGSLFFVACSFNEFSDVAILSTIGSVVLVDCSGVGVDTIVTVDAPGAAAFDTTIPVLPLEVRFFGGTQLLFLPSGITAQLSSNAMIGDTVLNVDPLPGAIPALDAFKANPVAGTRLADSSKYIENNGTTLAADALQNLAVQVGSLPVSSRAAVQAGTGVVDLSTLCRAGLTTNLP